MTEISQFLSQPLATHASLVVLQVAFIHGVRWILTLQAQRAADQWIEHFKTEPSASPDANKESNPARARLHEQRKIIRGRARHHLDVVIYFHTRYYMAIALFALVGGIAAIALVFITRFGWGDVSPYVINIFLVMSGHAAFYGAFPKIFLQEQNIADNKLLYTRYVALENEVESFFKTGEDIAGKWKMNSEFVHYIDQQLARLHNFAIGFDSSKVPSYKDTLEKLK